MPCDLSGASKLLRLFETVWALKVRAVSPTFNVSDLRDDQSSLVSY